MVSPTQCRAGKLRRGVIINKQQLLKRYRHCDKYILEIEIHTKINIFSRLHPLHQAPNEEESKSMGMKLDKKQSTTHHEQSLYLLYQNRAVLIFF